MAQPTFLSSVRQRIFWRYHRLRNTDLVWRSLLNRKAQRAWNRALPAVTPHEQEIADRVARDGIAVIPPGELFPPEQWFHIFQTYARKKETLMQERRPRREEDEKYLGLKGGMFGAEVKNYDKQFLMDLWDESDRPLPRLRLDSPFLQFALQDSILRIVGSYFGFAPKFHMCSLLKTLVVPSDAPAQFSQRWHRDSEDKKMLKVFMYCTDVDDSGAGPFRYVRASHGGGTWGALFPQHPPVGSYPPDGGVEKSVPESDILTCFGKAGTIIFCDTSGLHKGGFSTAKERIMYTAGFITSASFHPRRYDYPDESVLAPLSPLARFALTP